MLPYYLILSLINRTEPLTRHLRYPCGWFSVHLSILFTHQLGNVDSFFAIIVCYVTFVQAAAKAGAVAAKAGAVAAKAGAVAVKAGAVAAKAGAVSGQAGAVAVKAGAVADHFAVSAINFNVTLVVIKFRCNS